MTDEEAKKEPETEPEAEPEKEPEQQEPENDYAKQIEEIKAEFAAKLEAEKAAANKKIKERDDVIKQLLTGDKQQEPDDIILDRINQKRNYKKW